MSATDGPAPITQEPIDDRWPRLIEMPSPFEEEPGILRFREPQGGMANEQLRRLGEGTFNHPFIIDSGTTRNLYFALDAVQTSMLLGDPGRLVFGYTRKMMASLLFRPAPCHVLMIGLGGGSLAKFCYRHLPRARISVVEISAEVIALREQFAIPQNDERFQIIHADGAAYLARCSPKTDIILIDAFDDRGVAPSLASFDFYRRASRCLASDGILVMNLSGQKDRYAPHIEGLRGAFAGLRLVPVEGEDNLLLFAFKCEELAKLPDCLWNRAARLERELGLEFPRYLERMRAGQLIDCHGLTISQP